MCGIAGIYDYFRRTPNESLLKRFTQVMKHRGPNDSGTYSTNIVGLASVRLSILDLSEKGHMPMHSKDKKFTIIHNGEIYNFEEIRKKLEKKGYIFQTKTDTEVILNAYREYGENCLELFNGMFAFAIWDSLKKSLFIARDRMGIKPLYYTEVNKEFVFASEVKAILEHPKFIKEPNLIAISSYLSYRYPLGELSFFKNIKQLMPGHYIRVDETGITKKQWYSFPTSESEDLGEEYFMKKTRELIEESVRKRLVSDVPLGCYLSGGLDSTIITMLTKKLRKNELVKSYTIGFKEKEFNEFKFAKIAAKKIGTKHKEIILKPEDYHRRMKKLIRFKDAPLAVPNEIAIYLLSEELKKDITVVLSGEGADEIFCGYGRIYQSYNDLEKIQIMNKFPETLQKILFKNFYKKYGRKKIKNEIDLFLSNYNYFPFDEKSEIFSENMKESIKEDSELIKIFNKEFNKIKKIAPERKTAYIFEKLHLPGLLGRLDAPTMAVSVEGRVPFVDHELVEFLLTMPVKYRLKWKSRIDKIKTLFLTSDEFSEKNDITKYILRKAFENDIPKEILERKKVGFPVPLDNWFNGNLYPIAKKELLGKNSKIRIFFDIKKLEDWIELGHNEKRKGFGQKVWMILNLEYWLREYFV